jgi:hypothetical protein
VAFISLTHPKLSTHQRRLPGAPHWGGAWTVAVATLRAALKNASHHAWRSRFTAHQAFRDEVIDLVAQLDSRSLAVLRVVIGELTKQTKKQDCQW